MACEMRELLGLLSSCFCIAWVSFFLLADCDSCYARVILRALLHTSTTHAQMHHDCTPTRCSWACTCARTPFAYIGRAPRKDGKSKEPARTATKYTL